MTNEQINPFTALTLLDPKFRPVKSDEPMGIIGVWMWRFRSRRALARMDARMLDDIGMTAAELHHEASKPFWQA